MGVFKIFRSLQSSKSNDTTTNRSIASSSSSSSSFPLQSITTQIPPLTSSSSSSHLHTSPRPGLPPPSPSSNSITSRISRASWKKHRTTPSLEISGTLANPNVGKEDDGPPTPQGLGFGDVTTPKREQKRSTMIYLGKGNGNGLGTNESGPGQSSPSAVGGGEGKRRVSSGEFRQSGGILGKLGFEAVSPVGAPIVRREQIGEVGQRDVVGEAVGQAEGAELGEGRKSEDMEMLESAEKKGRFWKGVVRGRRMSKSGASDVEDDPREGSPTPRKASLPTAPYELLASPATRNTVDLPAARPQTLRRPSSSIFSPFIRSQSRASVIHPEPTSAIDDGSFQLKGFRHVSGTSDIDGTGGLGDYMDHVRRQSIVALTDDTSVKTTPTIGQPSPSRPRMSRPPSVAGSLVSADDLIGSSSRVSVAAFRRGIRRPSEGPMTMSEMGHGSRHDMDDEDDLPLGIVGRGMRTRDASAISLSSMRNEREDRGISPRPSPSPRLSLSPRPSPVPTPSPGLQMQKSDVRHTRNGHGSGGFVVKSARSTRVDGEPKRDRLDDERPVTVFALSHTSSPVSTSPMEVVTSPVASSDGYFAGAVLRPSAVQRIGGQQHMPDSIPTNESITIRSSTGESFAGVASPKVPPPPSVKSLHLPQPGDQSTKSSSPASIALPLPPDQMPDTPPKTLPALPSPSFAPSGHGPRKHSLLEEPLRVISGLWGSPSTQQSEKENQPIEDGFDTNLVIQSMAVLGGEDDLRPVSRATLFDASSVLTAERSRSPLSTRLANVASSSTLHRPSLGKLKVDMSNDAESRDGHSTEKMRSPGEVSDSNTVSPIVPRAVLQSSFVRARAPKPKRSTTGLIKKAWSSSDESDREIHTRTRPVGSKPSEKAIVSPDRKLPSGPRKISSRVRPGVGVRGKSLPKELDSAAEGSDASSSEEESLSILRAKASKSSLALGQYTSPASRSSPLLNGSVPPPLPSDAENTRSTALADRPALPTKSISTKVQPNSSTPPDYRRLAATATSSASPASSQSGLTSDSAGPHPVTPREVVNGQANLDLHRAVDSKVGTSQPWVYPTSSSNSNYEPTHQEERQRRYSSATPLSQNWQPQPPLQPPWPPTGHSYTPFPQPGIDPMAMHNYMKQAWQAHFMAAAYRASEDEWERASSSSHQPAGSIPPPAIYGGLPLPGHSPYSMPMGGFGGSPWGTTPLTMGAGMYPFPQQPGMMSSGSMMGSPSGQGMYSYGPGAQSVFGGEFGPPAQHQPYGYSYTGQSGSVSVSGGPTSPLRSDGGRPGHVKRGSGASSLQPPSSWRRKSGLSMSVGNVGNAGEDGEWEDAQTPKKGRGGVGSGLR